MSHNHMHVYTGIQSDDSKWLTDEMAFSALLDSIAAQEIVLGRSVEWTGSIGDPREEPGGVWVVYARALALTGNGNDGSPCSDGRDTIACEELNSYFNT